jgi:hypothetical protein
MIASAFLIEPVAPKPTTHFKALSQLSLVESEEYYENVRDINLRLRGGKVIYSLSFTSTGTRGSIVVKT